MLERPDLNKTLRDARAGNATFGNSFGGPPAHDSRFGLMDDALIRGAYERGVAEREAQTRQAVLANGGPGFLRDVYPMTLLSDYHLSASVGSGTLEKWIRADPRRGTLGPFGAKTLWTIETENLLAVQTALDPTGILLSSFPPD